MANLEIRITARQARIPLWRLAEKVYGIADSQFSRKLRHELPDAEKAKILQAIEALAKEAARHG